MSMLEQITNRLKKNYKHKAKWAKRNNIQAYRLYDLDIPDFPFIVDIYNEYVILYHKGQSQIDDPKGHDALILEAIKTVIGAKEENIIQKKRYIQDEENKYERFGTYNSEDIEDVIIEGNFKFKVNLTKYIDTGLFLDHRPLRKKLVSQAQGKRVLNLFCYTGSLSVASAVSAQKVTSVDMSNTYINWAKENFKINEIDPDDHSFIRADVFAFLDECDEKFDLIIIDPPSFSASKKMENTLDIQRDHEVLLEKCFNLLERPNGMIYFSNNLRKFKISPKLCETFSVKDITKWSIPEDFHDQKIHHLFEITRRHS